MRYLRLRLPNFLAEALMTIRHIDPKNDLGVLGVSVCGVLVFLGLAISVANGGVYFVNEKDGAPMALIPAGEFLMGSNNVELPMEQPVHRVSLPAFFLYKYEVTNKMFQKFVQETKHQTIAEKEGKGWVFMPDARFKEAQGATWQKPEGWETVFVSQRDEHPVVLVSWHDAEAYCRWAGQRLPTEAEFEYATRAGTTTDYWWGNGNPGERRVANIADVTTKRQFPGLIGDVVNGYDDGYARTAPVGSFEPNPWGLYDMTGNVIEWAADWYGPGYYAQSPKENPTGPSQGESRVLRGGSWVTSEFIRSAHRGLGRPNERQGHIGFRCAKDGGEGNREPR